MHLSAPFLSCICLQPCFHARVCKPGFHALTCTTGAWTRLAQSWMPARLTVWLRPSHKVRQQGPQADYRPALAARRAPNIVHAALPDCLHGMQGRLFQKHTHIVIFSHAAQHDCLHKKRVQDRPHSQSNLNDHCLTTAGRTARQQLHAPAQSSQPAQCLRPPCTPSTCRATQLQCTAAVLLHTVWSRGRHCSLSQKRSSGLVKRREREPGAGLGWGPLLRCCKCGFLGCQGSLGVMDM